VEGDPLELLRVVREAGLAVLVPEETRVGETCGEDLAVAVDYCGAAVGGFDIGGADEGVGETILPVVAQRRWGGLADEVFLVDAGG
jgi:hypothetical protein